MQPEQRQQRESGCNGGRIRDSHAVGTPAAALPNFNATTMARREGRPVVRFPEQLRLHPVLEEVGWADVIDEVNAAARLKGQSVPDPIVITNDGTILAGLGRWRLATLNGEHSLNCIEYLLSEEESLQFILAHHQSRSGWNAFTRIRAALRLEPFLQQRSLENLRAGGKYKGSANLPEAQKIDVRQEIARFARVGARNVSNVRTILRSAHPRVIEALQDGTLTINRAMQWCRQPKAQQQDLFTQCILERSTGKVIRQSVTRLKRVTSLTLMTVLSALRSQEARQPGSVMVRVSRLQRTVILIGKDALTSRILEGVLQLE